MARTNIILPATYFTGKHCKALSPGCNPKKSPVAKADSTMACLLTDINLGVPVVPEVCISI